ncbi:MAG: putative RNA polymerase sigma factor [Sphingobacteriales bacterium]
MHSEVNDYAFTNWNKSLKFYNHLQVSFPTPMGVLNRIVVYQMVHGEKAALKEFEMLDKEPTVTSHYLCFAVQGNLL